MRAELLGQLVGAQFDIERSLAELAGSVRAEGEQQLQLLKGLQRQIGIADPAMLKAMRAEISASVAIAHAAVQQGRTAATVETAAILADAALTSRHQVAALMQDMHRFDPYLRFASSEAEDAYRQREAERRAYIEAQQAKGTPQGDLNAAGGAVGQMVDAKAHGAGDSPEFQQRWAELAESTQKLRDAIVRDGGDMAQFDERLRDDFRRILKSKGVADAEIEKRLAEHPDNPLEAVKAYMGEGDDVALLERSIQKASSTVAETPRSGTAVTTNGLASTDPLAEFRAAGIKLADVPPEQQFTHGVSVHEPSKGPTGRRIVT